MFGTCQQRPPAVTRSRVLTSASRPLLISVAPKNFRATTLHRFCDVMGLDRLLTVEVRKRTGDPACAIEAACRQSPPFARSEQQPAAIAADSRKTPEVGRPHPRVALGPRDPESLALSHARGDDALPNHLRRLSLAAASQLFGIERGHLDDQVESIEKGP